MTLWRRFWVSTTAILQAVKAAFYGVVLVDLTTQYLLLQPHASSSPILPPYRSTTPGPYFDLQQRRTMSARPKSANQANNMGRNDRKTACELSNQIVSGDDVKFLSTKGITECIQREQKN